MNAIITFTDNGIVNCLHTELIDLHSLGRLTVERATTIEFNNNDQQWEVRNRRGKLMFFARSRQSCLDWELEHLG